MPVPRGHDTPGHAGASHTPHQREKRSADGDVGAPHEAVRPGEPVGSPNPFPRHIADTMLANSFLHEAFSRLAASSGDTSLRCMP